uniref:Uncharacterized protein n=1 Tax=viral metagenome TaxID=1070528 RepID=A0A6H2A4U4_9ZZZZ
MKSNKVKALEAHIQKLEELNRPQKRIERVRHALQVIINYEKLIEKHSHREDLCQLYAEKRLEIFNAIMNGC